MDLSVIISASNMQRYIAACLRSVTRCPRDTIEMECIVVHHSSTDETAAIVSRYFERDSRIRLVRHTGGYSGYAQRRDRGGAGKLYLIYGGMRQAV